MNVRTLFFTLLLLPALVYLLIQSIASGMLYLNQYHLDITLDEWNKQASAIPLAKWNTTHELALTMLAGHENNASVMNALGRLYIYRSIHLATNRKEKLTYAGKAMSYYRVVTRLRPAWAYGWMNLAIAKARVGRVDSEFIKSFLQVLHLDPWSKKTLPVIVKLGLLAWVYLDKEERQALLYYFVEAQEQRTAEVQNALSGSRMKLYCVLLTHHGSKASFCP